MKATLGNVKVVKLRMLNLKTKKIVTHQPSNWSVTCQLQFKNFTRKIITHLIITTLKENLAKRIF